MGSHLLAQLRQLGGDFAVVAHAAAGARPAGQYQSIARPCADADVDAVPVVGARRAVVGFKRHVVVGGPRGGCGLAGGRGCGRGGPAGQVANADGAAAVDRAERRPAVTPAIDVDLDHKPEDLAVMNPYNQVPVLVERDPIIAPDTLTLLISQSGETADTIAAQREAKASGGKSELNQLVVFLGAYVFVELVEVAGCGHFELIDPTVSDVALTVDPAGIADPAVAIRDAVLG